ncbi:hypothetical protein OH76DRAFT_148048 [Lentinus brumalis]|uniref:F-box domain-containing protein n=1 Tax=Lentinus brumalis TaxID=2498619 RepID=A0A371CP51_9APHY|nr:hypothetical protein OH76DRAFT_148048 [Polyporus brumalis]
MDTSLLNHPDTPRIPAQAPAQDGGYALFREEPYTEIEWTLRIPPDAYAAAEPDPMSFMRSKVDWYLDTLEVFLVKLMIPDVVYRDWPTMKWWIDQLADGFTSKHKRRTDKLQELRFKVMDPPCEPGEAALSLSPNRFPKLQYLALRGVNLRWEDGLPSALTTLDLSECRCPSDEADFATFAMMLRSAKNLRTLRLHNCLPEATAMPFASTVEEVAARMVFLPRLVSLDVEDLLDRLCQFFRYLDIPYTISQRIIVHWPYVSAFEWSPNLFPFNHPFHQARTVHMLLAVTCEPTTRPPDLPHRDVFDGVVSMVCMLCIKPDASPVEFSRSLTVMARALFSSPVGPLAEHLHGSSPQSRLQVLTIRMNLYDRILCDIIWDEVLARTPQLQMLTAVDTGAFGVACKFLAAACDSRREPQQHLPHLQVFCLEGIADNEDLMPALSSYTRWRYTTQGRLGKLSLTLRQGAMWRRGHNGPHEDMFTLWCQNLLRFVAELWIDGTPWSSIQG